MTDHNTSDFFHRAEFFLLRLCLFILLLPALAKFIWSEAAPFLSEVFRHFNAGQSQTNAPAPSDVVNHSSERYKGFLIDGSAVPTFATGFDWYSQGIILRPARLGSLIEVKRIKEPSSQMPAVYRPERGFDKNARVWFKAWPMIDVILIGVLAVVAIVVAIFLGSWRKKQANKGIWWSFEPIPAAPPNALRLLATVHPAIAWMNKQ
jgi:hypothetical protein